MIKEINKFSFQWTLCFHQRIFARTGVIAYSSYRCYSSHFAKEKGFMNGLGLAQEES